MSGAEPARAIVAVRPDLASARRIASQVVELPWTSRSELVSVQGARVGSGRTDGEFWQAGAWFVKSRRGRRFHEVAPAIAAAEQLFELKQRLGPLVPANSVFVVVRAGGEAQVWTVSPVLVTIRERLDATAAQGRWREFAHAIAAFAVVLGETLTASLEKGLGLDANPANFAIQGARLRYLDDDVTSTRDALGIEDAFVARFAEYAPPPGVWETYVRRTADEVRARTTESDRHRLGLRRRFAAAGSLRRGTPAHVEHLLALVEAT